MKKFIIPAGLAMLGLMVVSAPSAMASISAGTQALKGSGTISSCYWCAIYKKPKLGDTVILNPQPLPPKVLGQGTFMRR